MIGWIDGSAGASGDMLLGALVGAGVPIDVLRTPLDGLDLGIALSVTVVDRGGISATRVHVEVPEATTHRRLADIVELLAPIDEPIRRRAESVFRRLAKAEAGVHGMPVDEVHFHEVGALDSIADVVGVCAGFAHLENLDDPSRRLDALSCSTLALGSGRTRGAHGPIPVPVPAVLAVLAGVAPVEAGPAPFESTTPTGAALLAEWVAEWRSMPPMTVEAIGIGAGSKDSDAIVNATRLVLGSPAPGATAAASSSMSSARAALDAPVVGGSASGCGNDEVVVLDANVDDLDPRLWPGVIDAVLAAGALDAWLTPIVMKKGRPAHTFSAMCSPDDLDSVRRSVFAHTSTIGVRERRSARTVLERTESTVEVGGHSIRVKVSSLDGEVINRSAEFASVASAAVALGRPEADVLAAATAAMHDRPPD